MSCAPSTAVTCLSTSLAAWIAPAASETVHYLAFLATLADRSEELRDFLRNPAPSPAVVRTLYDTVFGLDFGSTLNGRLASERYANCHNRPGQKLARSVLLECFISSGAAGPLPDTSKAWCKQQDALRHRFRRALSEAAAPERPRRARNGDRLAQWTELVEYVGGALRREQQQGPRRDVDSRFAETASRRVLLESLFRVPSFQKEAARVWQGQRATPGPFPTVNAILRKIAEAHGSAGRLADYDVYTREMLGWEAEWSGQALGLDATGLDVEVQGAWGDQRDGKPKRWAFFMTDAASGRQWLHAPHCGSEQAGWPDALERLCRQLSWAPEFVFMDRVSTLIEGLSYIAPGEDLIHRRKAAVPLGVLFLLACGARPKVTRPNNPTGKAFVERGIGVAKDHFAGLLAERATALEYGGQLPAADSRARRVRRRRFENEPQFQKCVSALVNHVNTLPNFRGSGKSREEWFNSHAASIAKRQERALVPNAWQEFLRIAPRIRVGILAGADQIATGRGEEAVGQLSAPAAEDDRGAVLLIIPGGLLASDAPGLLRCYAIRRRQGLTCITKYEGTEYAMRDFGYRGPPRPIGEFKAKPETEGEMKRHAAQIAARKYEEALPKQQPAAVASVAPAPATVITLPAQPQREEDLAERVRRLAGA